jgi:hypothetical protein
MLARKAKIRKGGVCHRFSLNGRLLSRLPKLDREFLETLNRDCCDDRVSVREMRVEHRLAIFDLVSQAADRDRIPSFPGIDQPCGHYDTLLACCSLPTGALEMIGAILIAISQSRAFGLALGTIIIARAP